MTFIKVGNIVLNTSYIAVVKLKNGASSGEDSLSLLIAMPKFLVLDRESITSNPYHYEWMEFRGSEAKALQDYFSSFNNALDLIPSYQELASV